MSEDAALIEQPEGSPGAVSDAGSSLARVAGGFERGGGVVARASSTVSAWQGPASVSFDGRVASYGLVMVAVEQVLQTARGAVRRYETALEDARTKIRELREQEEMAVARLNRAKTQLADAQTRLGQARERMSAVSAGAGMLDPASLGEQVQAGRDADNAQTDIDTAQKQIDAEREEIRELREDAKRVEKQLIEEEDNAAAAVRAAAGRLPDVQLPGGAASPSAYTGTPFGGPLSPFASDPRWAEGMRKAAEGEDDDDNNDGPLDDAWDWASGAAQDTANAASGLTHELSFGTVDLGGDKDSGAYKTGEVASYIPVNPASALKSAGTGLLKLGAKTLGKNAAEEGGETTVRRNIDDAAGRGDETDLTTPRRRDHVLKGDETGGGHRPGTGKPGKTEFPEGWSDERILHEIADVATDPASDTHDGPKGRVIVEGTRDGVRIRVIIASDGEIVTGYPTNLPRNPR